MDLFRLPLRQRALRCRTCSARFYARPGPAFAGHTRHSRKVESRRGPIRFRRWMVEATIFVVLLMLFWTLLKFLTREHAGLPDVSNTPAGSAKSRI